MEWFTEYVSYFESQTVKEQDTFQDYRHLKHGENCFLNCHKNKNWNKGMIINPTDFFLNNGL